MIDVKAKSEQTIKSLIAADGSGWYTSRGVLFNHSIFGRDVSMMSRWTFGEGQPFRDAARGAIHSLCKYQGLHRNRLSEEEPGRILNEYKPFAKWQAPPFEKFINWIVAVAWGSTSSAELDFIGLDSTPMFVQLVCDYAETDLSVLDERVTRRDDNTVLVRQCLLEAIEWMMDHRSAHGFVASRRRNPFSLFFQSWRDSHLAYIYPDGRLASLSRPVVYLEVQLACIDALRAAADLFGHALPSEAAGWRTAADELAEATLREFWMEDEGLFAMALDPTRSGRLVPIPTPASSQGWMLDSTIFDGRPAAERRRYVEAIIRRLQSPQFMTVAGIRARGNGSDAGLGVADYHGSWTVWPVDNYKYARGLRRQGFPALAADIEARIVHAVQQGGSFYEFFLVSPAGEVLWRPHEQPKVPPRRQVNLQIVPERDLGWTTTACYLITHQTHPRRGHTATEPWRLALENELLHATPAYATHHQTSAHPFGVRSTRGALKVAAKATAALIREYIQHK